MKKELLLSILLLWLFTLTKAQDTSSPKSENFKLSGHNFYKTPLFKATIVPALFIGWGLSTIHEHGLYSSYDAYHNIHKLHFKGTHWDNYLQYAPYIELIGLNLINIRGKNDFINMALIIVKSELIMSIAVQTLKHVTHELRPDSSNAESFPSGHSATVFLAASLVHKEFKHKSIWYGVGAYTVATSVGILRMLNDKHWESDVFVGAGIGILSVNLTYLTHRYRWGKKCNVLLTPSYNKGAMGFCLVKTL